MDYGILKPRLIGDIYRDLPLSKHINCPLLWHCIETHGDIRYGTKNEKSRALASLINPNLMSDLVVYMFRLNVQITDCFEIVSVDIFGMLKVNGPLLDFLTVLT